MGWVFERMEVILGLEWGPPINIWSLGCMVPVFPLAYPPDALLTTPLKMYEFATCRWLFTPEGIDNISRDIRVHLAQMTQRTSRDHDDLALKQYET